MRPGCMFTPSTLLKCGRVTFAVHINRRPFWFWYFCLHILFTSLFANRAFAQVYHGIIICQWLFLPTILLTDPGLLSDYYDPLVSGNQHTFHVFYKKNGVLLRLTFHLMVLLLSIVQPSDYFL